MILVTRGIVIHNGCLLAAQRPASMSLPYKWELPGGKFEVNETPEECLRRETLEELGLIVRVLGKLEPVDHYFREKTYRMLPYLCEVIGGKLSVNEHEQAEWIPFIKIFKYDWAPAEKILLMEWTQNYKTTSLSKEIIGN